MPFSAFMKCYTLPIKNWNNVVVIFGCFFSKEKDIFDLPVCYLQSNSYNSHNVFDRLISNSQPYKIIKQILALRVIRKHFEQLTIRNKCKKKIFLKIDIYFFIFFEGNNKRNIIQCLCNKNLI